MYQRRHLNILKSRMAEPRRRMQIVMGPRQVGKSTLVGQFTEGISVPFDFFAADGVNRFDSSWIPNKWQQVRMRMDIHSEQEHILIIDEVQKIRCWSEQVKKEWDEDSRSHRNLKVILLGSSRLLLQKGLEESLEGRFETIKWAIGIGRKCTRPLVFRWMNMFTSVDFRDLHLIFKMKIGGVTLWRIP